MTFTEFVLGYFLDETDNLFYFTAASQLDVALPLRRFELQDAQEFMPCVPLTLVERISALFEANSFWPKTH